MKIHAASLIVSMILSPAHAVIIETVDVHHVGNAPDTRYNDIEVGRVPYQFKMATYEITSTQYAEFLNAVAATDTYYLYNPSMYSVHGCGVRRTGSAGSYSYYVEPGWEDRPVSYVSWGDAARFANWMHNGQPTGPQDLSSTEDGSYWLNGALSLSQLMNPKRKLDATWVIPSESEWYKAAYHKNDGPTGNYWNYPTQSDSAPGTDITETTNPGNNANYGGDGINPIDPPIYTTLPGEFEWTTSAYGCFDMGGNVWEWNEESYFGMFRGLRAGAWQGSANLLHADNFNAKQPIDQNRWFGFRLAKLTGIIGDCDGDGDVDLDNYAAFEACLSGPESGLGTDCDCFDTDRNGDVTLADFAEIQIRFDVN